MIRPPYITEDILASMQGVIPAVIASSNADNIPNATYISQVYYVDEKHVALSRQFFNKTARNVIENPYVCVVLMCPIRYTMYKMMLRFNESLESGPIYEQMALQLEAIAQVQGQHGVFHLQAADIFEVESIEEI